MQFKYFGFYENINLLSRGNNLIFVKILNEFKTEIMNSIKRFEKERALKYLSNIENFQKGLLHSTQKSIFVIDILELLEQELYIDYSNLKKTINQNLCKEYLYENFTTWWYQSLYFMKGAGYIKNINEFCQEFLLVSKDIYTKEEVQSILEKSFHISTVPFIFSKKELKDIKKIHNEI